MKKLLALGAGLITLLLAFTLVAFGVMHTRYFTPSAQWLTEQLWPDKLSFSELEYEYPAHFTLHNVAIETEQTPIAFQQVDIWLNEKLIEKDKLIVDSILLEGANFAQGLPSSTFLSHLKLNQLAIHNVDFSQHGLIARGVNLQVKKPIWESKEQYLPYGEVQLSAEQFYWQGEAFDNILVDADYKPQDSTIYGASFKWQGGDFSGQAEQYRSGWSLINTTISRLTLSPSLSQTAQKLWKTAAPYISHINSLDILSSHLVWDGLELDNVAASLEDLSLTNSLWQQPKGVLSLNADSATWRGLQWVEPRVKLTFSQQKITINDFSTELLQGNVQLTGDVTPDNVHLSQLRVNGIKWFAEHEQDFVWLQNKWPTLKGLTIDQLTFNNLQLIQLMQKPFWQLSGLTVEGNNAEFIRDAQWGLWNGSIIASANSASYDNLVSTQGVIEMHSKAGKWQLERAFIPLEKGYMDAQASWDFSTASAPWSLNAHIDGFPLPLISGLIDLPVKIDAIADLDMNAEGLAGDYSMFAHSLSGKLSASLRDGTMVIHKPESVVVQPFSLDNIELNADRGRLTLNATPLSGISLNAAINAQLDLVSPQEGQFELNVTDGCEKIHYDLLHNQQVYQACQDVN